MVAEKRKKKEEKKWVKKNTQ